MTYDQILSSKPFTQQKYLGFTRIRNLMSIAFENFSFSLASPGFLPLHERPLQWGDAFIIYLFLVI